ncbi:MAG: hypothetical protein QM753_15680 [Thermomicrobiales bacterium]
MMTFTGDVFFRHAPEPAMLRTTIASSLGFKPEEIMLRDEHAETSYPGDARVVVLRLTPNVGGDFPARYDLMMEADRLDDLPQLLSGLATATNSPILADADSDDPLAMVLYLTDGSRHLVSVDQGHDGGIRITPFMQALIASTHRQPMRLAS